MDGMEDWLDKNVSPDWMTCRNRIMLLLQEESELDEIVNLVGMDALSAPDRIKLEAARSIRRTICIRTHSMKWTPLHRLKNSF